MKILFLIPPEENYIGASASKSVDYKRECRPKLGILYVASYLKNEHPQDEIKLLDCPSEGFDFEDCKKELYKIKPDLIGITAVTFTIVDALKAASGAKKILPQVKICLGGWHTKYYPKETLLQEPVDFVVTGEGEITFSELVSHISKALPENELSDIKGLGFKKNGNPFINPPRPLIEDLDSLPYPDWNLMDIKKYSHVLSESDVNLPVETSRGCPFKCIFCDQRKSRFRSRTAQSIISELKHLNNIGVYSVFFTDDQFTTNKNRAVEICKGIIGNEIRLSFKISARVNSVDDELMGWLKKAGCSNINFGVESSKQKFRDYLEKGITNEQIEKAFSLCRKYGINSFAYVMIGIPGQTRQDIMDDLKFLRKIKADYASFSVCSPYPRTKMYEMMLEKGIFKEDFWQKFAENPEPGFRMPLCNREMPEEELRKLQIVLMRRFYLSPHSIIKNLKRMKSASAVRNIIKVGMRILFNR